MSFQGSPYVLCPIRLLEDRRLTSFSKELYLYIKNKHNMYSTTNKDGRFFESMASMASEFGVTERTVRRAVDLLSETGWVNKSGGGQRETLVITPTL